jgi:hypothetical protein
MVPGWPKFLPAGARLALAAPQDSDKSALCLLKAA